MAQQLDTQPRPVLESSEAPDLQLCQPSYLLRPSARLRLERCQPQALSTGCEERDSARHSSWEVGDVARGDEEGEGCIGIPLLRS